MTKRINVEHIRTALRLAKMWEEHGPGLSDAEDNALFQLGRSIAAHDEPSDPTCDHDGVPETDCTRCATEPTEAPRTEGRRTNDELIAHGESIVGDAFDLTEPDDRMTAIRLLRALYNLGHSDGDAEGYARGLSDNRDSGLLQELHGYVRDMCVYLGVDPKERPADAWTLRDEIIRLKGALEAASPQATPAPTRYANIVGRIESALGVSGPDDYGQRVLAAIEQLQIAHRVSYENGQELARRFGELVCRSPAPTASAAPTARERLGRWLAAEPDRTWKRFEPDPTSRRMADKWTIKLVDRLGDVAIKDRRTEDEAIASALDAAEARKP